MTKDISALIRNTHKNVINLDSDHQSDYNTEESMPGEDNVQNILQDELKK